MKCLLRRLEIRFANEMPAGIRDLFYFKIAKQSFQDALKHHFKFCDSKTFHPTSVLDTNGNVVVNYK